MADPVRLAVVGATGAIGRQILKVLERGQLDLAELIPVASRATRVHTVEFAGRDLPVHDETTVDYARADIILAAPPPDFDRDELQPALDKGGVVVDVAGLWREDSQVPVVAPWCNEVDLEHVLTAGVVRSPRPLSLALAAVARPLHAALGLTGLRGTAMIPASTAGRGGAEDLSGQVIALFNQTEPPRAVFPDGLAFDLVPAWGERDDLGWTAEESLAAAEVAAVTGVDPTAVAMTAVLTPIFAGMGLSLHAVTEGHLGVEEARSILERAPKLSLIEPAIKPLMTRARLNMEVVAVGRLRADPAGAGLHLWAACDPVHLAAVNAVELAVQIVERGYL